MKTHKSVLKNILSDIAPTKKDISRLKKIQKEILSQLKIPHTKAVVGGSGAKNTWLKNTHDIDIYVKFDYKKYSNKSKELSDILNKYLKKPFPKLSRVHGSRDYFQINHEGYTLEIIPILDIKKAEQAKNITDFSVHHVKYINKQTKKSPKLANEIRLAKVFARANKFYGAESYIKGVSGYVLEILVSKYGSFTKFTKNASKWKDKTVIGKIKEAERLNWAKKLSPLIIIDPVQPDRNAAAALSNEQYKNIIKFSKKFTKSPSESFFEQQPININKLKKKGNLTIIEVQPVKGKKDVSGAKALKAFEFIVKHSKNYEIADSLFDYGEILTTYYIVTNKNKISNEYKHYGPPLDNKKALVQFKKTNKLPIKTDRKLKKYYVIKKRENNKIRDHLKDLLQREEVTSRIKNSVLLN
jgi:tRNA nucleotidyltransferase (CCA-adding enzyme)